MSTATPRRLRDEAVRLRREADLLDRIDDYQTWQCAPVGAALTEASQRLRAIADRLWERGEGVTTASRDGEPQGAPRT